MTFNKSKSDKDVLTFRELGISLEQSEDIQVLIDEDDINPNEGAFSPKQFDEIIENTPHETLHRFYKHHLHTSLLNNPEQNGDFMPMPLFNTAVTPVKGLSVHQVQTIEKKSGPSLELSNEFQSHMHNIGKLLMIQYAVISGKTPREIANEIPYDIYSYDIIRIREFVEEHTLIKANIESVDGFFLPVGQQNHLHGVLYMMYIIDGTDIIPKYIGMSDLMDTDITGLNWNFKNITKQSVLCRWGNGSGQHIGELNKAIFPRQYDNPRPKYDRWADDLFYNQDLRILNRPVYITVTPWFDSNIHHSERNLIKLADEFHGERLLNVEYTKSEC